MVWLDCGSGMQKVVSESPASPHLCHCISSSVLALTCEWQGRTFLLWSVPINILLGIEAFLEIRRLPCCYGFIIMSINITNSLKTTLIVQKRRKMYIFCWWVVREGMAKVEPWSLYTRGLKGCISDIYEQTNKELSRLYIREQVPHDLRQCKLPQTSFHLLARFGYQERVCALPRQMWKNAMVWVGEHYLLEPQHKDTRNVPVARINGKPVLFGYQEGEGRTYAFQKVDRTVWFQPRNNELHQPHQRTKLQQHLRSVHEPNPLHALHAGRKRPRDKLLKRLMPKNAERSWSTSRPHQRSIHISPQILKNVPINKRSIRLGNSRNEFQSYQWSLIHQITLRKAKYQVCIVALQGKLK